MTGVRHTIIACLLSLAAMGQDPQFSQFYAAPMYLNPALTGNTAHSRATLNYRSQWHGVSSGFDTYAIAYDRNVSSSNSAFGLMAVHDVAGPNALKFTKVQLSYAWKARVGMRSHLRAGIGFGMVNRSYDPSSFLFADQVIRDSPVSIEMLEASQVIYPDVSAGLIYSNRAWWGGISLKHLNRPQQSVLPNGNVRLPTRTSIHGGFRKALDRRKLHSSNAILILATQYKFQGKWDQLDLGTYLQFEHITVGLWYRGLPFIKPDDAGPFHQDAIIFMMGYRINNSWRFSYSYDATISELGVRSGGANEIALVHEWGRKKKPKYRIVACPVF